MNHLTHIEPLEDRIAPATIINPYTVTFQDADGDTAVVHISKPLFKSAAKAGAILEFATSTGVETFTGNSSPENLSIINLLGRTDAAGMNISVKVVPQAGVGSGNLHVNVGSIQAANISQSFMFTQNIDLGSIYIQGNLGSITAGGNISTPGAIKSLTVDSMDAVTNSQGQVLTSTVLGTIGKLNVLGDFTSNLNVIGYQFGSIGRLTIGGSLTGDTNGDSGTGEIQFSGHIGKATIGNITGSTVSNPTGSSALNANTGELFGNTTTASRIGTLNVLGSITGGSGSDSGLVFANSLIGKLNVTGSIKGGSGGASGLVQAPMRTVNIGGSIIGSSGGESGFLNGQNFTASGSTIDQPIKSVTVGGDVVGGSGVSSGGIAGILGTVVIKGNLTGGSGTSSGSVFSQQTVLGGSAPAPLKTLAIGGNVTGGTAGTAPVAGTPPTAAVAGDTGMISASSANSIRIGGSLIGGASTTAQTAETSGVIMITGQLKSAVIYGGLTGSQSIDTTQEVIESGYIQAGEIVSLDIHGSVTAGVNTSTGKLANCGAIRSSSDIGSLVIGGNVVGTSANPFVISGQQGSATVHTHTGDQAIGSVKIGGDATYLNLLAGYSPNVSKTTSGATDPAGAPLGTPVDGSAQINTVTITGKLSASNIVAGSQPNSTTGQFGTTGDTLIKTKVNANAISRIASLIVTGTAMGDNTNSGDTFGIVAQDLASVTVQGTQLAVGLTPGTPKPVGSTNLYLLEVTS